MVKITQAAMKEITSEIQEMMVEGEKPLIRFSMGIG